ncbi:glycoprotein [Zea mays]|jgi:hypothetical protein|uniref:Glycoprotein n=1 Tax=Zea mays TaxID=4577 RepID=A0A1D6K8L5_MAIZE|nr:glycoprotein [Zea mays]ONL99864.1 Glycoprotein [Zea mays]|eukprot:NP_001151220.2 glycoprotein [Zea mays]
MAAQQKAASVLQSFPFKAAVLALCVALLPLLPTQAPDVGAGGPGQEFLAKVWELLHLLFVGIAVSYGLFSRKNSADDGRAGAVAVAAEKHAATGPEPAKADARYAWRMFRDSIPPFDDEDENDVLVPGSPPGGGGGGRARSWRAPHWPVDPVVVVSTGGGGDRIGQAADAQAPLSLPVRTLKAQPAQDASAGAVETPRARRRRNSQDMAAGCARDETVLASPIPWRSRSGKLDARRPASPSSTPSPKTLSPASSLSGETLADASEEEYYAKAKRSSPYRSSSISSPPPPPPPPPPFLVHGYHPATERRAAAAKSFKEELQHHSMRGRGEDHYSLKTSSISISAYNSSNSSPAKPRSSFDGGFSSSVSVGKSVRTFRAREAAVFQDQNQELPDGAGDDRDVLDVHGSEEPYGYRAYQSIHRFQYERSGSDPILGGVVVSSDETESSDDDDDSGGGGYSTRESTPEVDENEVDKKAEEFIARFREQIRRQRIESIKKSAGSRGVKHHGK